MAEGPESLVCVRDFKLYARHHLPQHVWHFLNGGAGYEQTTTDNEAAFMRWRLRPRHLRDVSQRDLTTTLLGQPVSFPLGISPSSVHKMVHPVGEVATAKAAASMKTVMILSSASSYPLEDVARAVPNGLLWFQLYIDKNRSFTRELVNRAEKAGFKALVLTVDAQYFGRRWEVMKQKEPFPSKDVTFANYTFGGNVIDFVKNNFDPQLTWKDVKWLKTITSLPIIIKGILTGEDAVQALENGASAIMVSNHGGRQLDGVLATIDALPEVVQAVDGRCEVYLDGGVTVGTDILKALALGARAVFIGRTALWGLSYQGEMGVKRILTILKEEFDLAMALSGCTSVEEIKPFLLQHSNQIISKI